MFFALVEKCLNKETKMYSKINDKLVRIKIDF